MMSIVNRIAAVTDDITAWRRDFHQDPELLKLRFVARALCA